MFLSIVIRGQVTVTPHRCVGYTYYNLSFATTLVCETVLWRGRVRPLVSRLLALPQARGNSCTSLYPQAGVFWLQRMEDVWGVTMGAGFVPSQYASSVTPMGMMKHSSIDGTLRVMRRVKGQVEFMRSASQKKNQGVPACDARRLIITAMLEPVARVLACL